MARHTVALKGDFIRKEGVASAAITPGHLVEWGGAADYRVHSTVGGAARRAFALENDLVGQDITQAYDANDTVQVGLFVPGAEVYAITTAAVNRGDALESNGDGRLKAASTPIEGSTIAYAAETIGAGGRCAVEVA